MILSLLSMKVADNPRWIPETLQHACTIWFIPPSTWIPRRLCHESRSSRFCVSILRGVVSADFICTDMV